MKYYTLPNFKAVHDNYNAALKEANSLGLKNTYPLGFESEEEAEALRTGNWASYFRENCYVPKIDADAIVYADGSYEENGEEKYGAYGIIIFFRGTDEIFVESARMQDTKPGEYIVHRYDRDGQEKEDGGVVCSYQQVGQNPGFVSASYQDAGEFGSVKRALQICREKNRKKVAVITDSQSVLDRFGLKGQKKKDTSNVAYDLGIFFEEVSSGMEIVFPPKVNSHGKNGQYAITSPLYLHGVYNDLVDALAKAETEKKPISRKDNFNLVRTLLVNGDFQTFEEATKERNMHAREMLAAVLQVIKPEFV